MVVILRHSRLQLNIRSLDSRSDVPSTRNVCIFYNDVLSYGMNKTRSFRQLPISPY